jgi:hypothetical protein
MARQALLQDGRQQALHAFHGKAIEKAVRFILMRSPVPHQDVESGICYE